MSINRELIVPFRRHSLGECHEIISQAGSITKRVTRVECWVDEDDFSEARQWLECLENPSKPLDRKEFDLITSFQSQLDERDWLSERQLKILEQIYVRKG